MGLPPVPGAPAAEAEGRPAGRNPGTALGWLAAAGSALPPGRCCPGKSRPETSAGRGARRAAPGAGAGGDESGRPAGRGAGSPTGPGACAGRGGSPAQPGPGRIQACGARPSDDPGAGPGPAPRGGRQGRPPTLAPLVGSPEAHARGYLLPRLLPAGSAASEARLATRRAPFPRRDPANGSRCGGARGAAARDGAGGGQSSPRGTVCASGAGRRARGRVCMCAPVSQP